MAKRIACSGGVWFSKIDQSSATQTFYSPLCKRKSCVNCAKIRKLQIAWRIRHAIATVENTNWYFCTLTMDKKWHGAGNTPRVRKVMQSGWSRLRKRMARRWRGLLWVKVIELHETDTPHIHFIVGISTHYKRQVKTKWLKDSARACGLGYIALVGTRATKDKPMDAEDAHNMTYYMTKYVSKGEVIGIRALAYCKDFPPAPAMNEKDVYNWVYEGREPNFERLADNLDIVYKTDRNLLDEQERQDVK